MVTKRLTILIVEDDEGHAFLIRQNLEHAGVQNPIRHFQDGQAFLDFLFKEPHLANEAYVVLLDIRMPKVDGTEVLRRIKADPALRKLPVIMLTTTDDAREVERCHQLGCNGYVQKPVDYEKFADAIQRIGTFVPLLIVPPLQTA